MFKLMLLNFTIEKSRGKLCLMCHISLDRLMAFRQKRKEFDQDYGNDDDGGIKTEIVEKLLK